MPTYCYTTADGETVTRFRQSIPKRIAASVRTPDGRLANRDYTAESKGGGLHAKWPIASFGAAVHPKQIKEHERFLASHGIEAKHMPDGRVIMENPQHRQKILKARGMVDLAGYK